MKNFQTSTEVELDKPSYYHGRAFSNFNTQGIAVGHLPIVLGTEYQIPVKWLSSLEDPIEVLHITGALLDKTGKIYRAGAEGILAAEPASFFQSIIDLQNALRDDKIKSPRTSGEMICQANPSATRLPYKTWLPISWTEKILYSNDIDESQNRGGNNGKKRFCPILGRRHSPIHRFSEQAQCSSL